MALYLFGPLIFSCFRVVRQKNPIPQSLLFHIHRSWNLRCPSYFEPIRHRVDFVALQLRSETIISSSLRYFPASSCQIKWNKTLIPRVAGFIILSLKGLRRDEISCGVDGHVYLFLYFFIYLSVRLVYAGNDVTRPCAGGLMV